MIAGLDPIQEQEKPPGSGGFSRAFDRLVGATEAIAGATNDGDAL
jgi:hypothetical protein